MCLGGFAANVRAMELKLELAPMRVSDIDRAKAFYVDALDCREDVDGNSWTIQEMSWRTGDRS